MSDYRWLAGNHAAVLLPYYSVTWQKQLKMQVKADEQNF